MNFEHDHAVLQGASTITKDFVIYKGYNPYQYSSPQEELLAARESAWFGSYLNMSLVGRTELWGPDAAEFLNRICVNRDYSKLKVGGSRHALICNEKGQIMVSGIITKLDEEYYRTYCLSPVLLYYLEKTELNVEYKVVEEYFYQIDGPRSLEIMEKACQCDLHDLKFGQNKTVKIAGTDVFIHRLGMSGALAYEMHGAPEDSEIVYNTILEAGKEFGMKQLGCRNYCSNHTSGGYPNQFIHFIYPWNSSGKEIADYLKFPGFPLCGSAANDEENYYVTPYDVGWGNLVNFDHEFPGKAALEEYAKKPQKKVVTLEWNIEDLKDIYVAEVTGDIDADEGIEGYREDLAEFRRAYADKVLVNGEMIGVAVGRSIDYHYKKFLSLAFLSTEYAEEEMEVVVLWGKPGTAQREIRAKVARFPYFNEEYRNETFDVNKIPQRF